MAEVTVLIGAGSIGLAIARRTSSGRHVLVADLRQDNADAAAKTLGEAGFDTSTAVVDVSSRASVHALAMQAQALGDVFGVIHAAGVSPSQAPPAVILHVDLLGTALVLEEFGNVIARGGSGVVIASQSGHRLVALTEGQNRLLATTPADDLLALQMLQPERVTDPLNAYQIAKRGNSLRVMAEAVRWGKRGARVNTISPGIIITPLAGSGEGNSITRAVPRASPLILIGTDTKCLNHRDAMKGLSRPTILRAGGSAQLSSARLRGAGLAVADMEALALRIGLQHVFAFLGLAVVLVALAVVDLARRIGPHLAIAAAGALFHRGGRRF